MDPAAVAVLKRPAEQHGSEAPASHADTADTIPAQSIDDVSGSCIITNGLQAAKRQKPSPTVDGAAAAVADNHPADQTQHKVPEQQDRSHLHHDRSHLRKQHAGIEDSAEAEGGEQQQQQQPGQHLGDDQQQQQPPAQVQQQQHDDASREHKQQQQQRDGPDKPAAAAPGSHHKHKRHNQKAHKHNLLSFEEELEGLQEEEELLAESATAAAAGGSSKLNHHHHQQQQQQHGGGLGKATAAKFAAESRAAAVAAARATLQPVIFSSSSGSNAAGGGSGQQQQQQQGGLVDEDEANGLRRQAPASLSRIHFGMSQARGARPYMEDRHCIVTALKPSSTTAAAAGGHGSHGSTAAAAADDGPRLTPPHDSHHHQQQQHHVTAGVVQDGVERCYAAIFDGHNGAGAAETAARQLHLLLASHPALKIYKGDPGPPAVVRQEEVAVGKALKAAFRQVDDLVLAVARRDGTRDGATALVVLRLGGVLYAAHAGDSRAVLCREGQAHRLTEDHKPHLPQERQRIEDAGGRVDFQRCWRVVVEPRDGRPGSGLAVSRSLGDLDFKEPARFVECDPDVTRLPLQPHKDSFVILGSDGLWDVLSDTDAVATAAAALKAYTLEHQRSNSHVRASEAAVECATELYRHHQQYNVLPWQQQQQQQYNSSSTAGCGGQSGGGGSNGSAAEQQQQQQRGQSGGSNTSQFMYTDGAATAAAEALLAESMRRGTMDNVTVIVMLLQWE